MMILAEAFSPSILTNGLQSALAIFPNAAELIKLNNLLLNINPSRETLYRLPLELLFRLSLLNETGSMKSLLGQCINYLKSKSTIVVFPAYPCITVPEIEASNSGNSESQLQYMDVNSFQWAKNGASLLTLSNENTINVWDTNNLTRLHSKTIEDKVYEFDTLPDGGIIVRTQQKDLIVYSDCRENSTKSLLAENVIGFTIQKGTDILYIITSTGTETCVKRMDLNDTKTVLESSMKDVAVSEMDLQLALTGQ